MYDTASVGIGGAAGAKIGILVGNVLGPIGAGVGLVLGGVGGAFGGKFFARKIKNPGLKKKREVYNSAVTQVGMIMPSVIDHKKQLVTTKMDKAVKSLNVPWWHSLWPSREGYIAEGLGDKYRKAINKLDKLKNHLQSLPSVQSGEEACKTASEGGFYDPGLMKALDRVRQTQEELLREMRRLGLA